MPKIDITRTELVWPGKYDADGNLVPPRRVSLPFQVIERVSETRATRQQREAEKKGHAATLFDYWQEGKVQTNDLGDGWRNKLIWGDNLYILGSLAEKFAGKLDLIYIDPPFATGTDFSFKAEIGDGFMVRGDGLHALKVGHVPLAGGRGAAARDFVERAVVVREVALLDELADTA